MFGYIRPQVSDLLVKENEFYNAVYCGLCYVGGKKISRFTRFFLDHDFVFLTIVRMAADGEKACIEKRRCPYRLKKKCMLCENDALVYSAAVFGILLYYKIDDNVKDSKGIKKIFYLLLRILASPMHKRASNLYPDTEKEVNRLLNELYENEKNYCASPDKAADCFAKITSFIACGGVQTENKHQLLAECGYHIGRYIYLIDAFADSAGDAKKNEYNVFNIFFDGKVMQNSDKIKQTLDDSVFAFCRAYEKLGGSVYDNLIYNTVQLGTKNAFAKILDDLKGNNK